MNSHIIKLLFLSAIMVISALPNSLVAEQTPQVHATASRFLAQTARLPMLATCNRYPRICRSKGSPGPDCCGRRCVDVDKDRWNCGKCGNRCSFSEVCCKGKCVNPWTNNNHCGGCANKCRKGNKCVYGMCNYA